MPTLEWIGKDKVINHHNDVPYRVLDEVYTYGADKSENKIIRGDNLEALKALLPQYEGKIKCIYIDPPYNTGEENWVYSDSVNDPKIKKWLGEVVGKEGEDLSRHDKWLCMMYPRLKLLQRLLADNGAIFISIDDNELYNLKLICDEIFGAVNYVTTFVWEKRLNRENRKVVSSRHDYIVCYAKKVTSDIRPIKLLDMTEEALKRYQNPDNDLRGPWKSDPAHAQAGHGTSNQFYVLTAPNGKKHSLPAGRCWLYTEQVMEAAIQDGRIWFGKDGNNVPRIKTFLMAKNRGLTPESMWFANEVSTNEAAKNELKRMFSEAMPFTTPKPHQLIERILQIATDKNSIILDSFAGSGTTAHAVLNMNKADGGNRKFILVELMDYAETITAERVRRVINGYGEGKNAVEGTGGDFTFYDLGAPLMIDNQYLNEDVPLDKLRQYVFFMETKQTMGEGKKDEPYLLGTYQNAAYYFYYEKETVTTLDHSFLATIKTQMEEYLIYADINALSNEELAKYHIIFKKIPRDIAKL
ncbi:MAG: site-specific DNA-methyltransferase [Anaerovoracaceae bacterium]